MSHFAKTFTMSLVPPTLPAVPTSLLRACCLLLAVSVLAACAFLPATRPAAPQGKPPRQAEQAKKVAQARPAERPSVVCSAKQGNPFAMRKKVLILSLPVLRPGEAVDLPDIALAWSNALQLRLQKKDHFLIRDGSSYAIDSLGDVRQQTTTLARMLDAQIVIAGQITSLGSLPQPFVDKRVLETVLDVYDGDSGARLARLEQHGEVRGRVLNQGSPLRGGFFDTSLGSAVAIMLEQQVADIEDELSCLPLQAHIVRTHGDEARLDAGYTSHIRPGDSLRVTQRQGFPGSGGEQIEKTFGNLVVKQVFPETAIGQFQGTEQPDWRYSVFVRAW